ncbi:probable NOT transcription complex subunit VIP2 [Brassica rapa]|uniref:probable NOT transcription complex subunit VIP2 n=1 Tax=Brassica campestris TaxID=3711 RepID=UPI000872AF2C|nr:probable NOT transcription complex subunit VIP2 [Brassica rapa]
MSMLGNSYHTGGGPLSQNHAQSVNNMMLSDHSNDSSLFDINNDFSQRSSRPGSASGNQGQLGSASKMKTFLPYLDFKRASFNRLSYELLFYTFYSSNYCSSMPKDQAHLYAADELYDRGWFYHKELRLWLFRDGEPLVRTAVYERGTYECLDPNSFKTVGKETFCCPVRAYGKETKLSAEIDFK